jgi:vacuolar-type H+-ATPase subunit F/Vma7
VTENRRAFAVGSQVFVDLWSLLGFVPLPCESPGECPSVLSVLGEERPAFVAVERAWFEGLQETVKKRLEKSSDPVWIVFPSCESAGYEVNC